MQNVENPIFGEQHNKYACFHCDGNEEDDVNEKKIFDDLNFKENLKFWRALHTSVTCSHCEIDKEEMVVKKKRMVMM